MKVRIAGPAQRHAEIIDRWWRQNRREAKGLFVQELGRARRLLASQPDVGAPHEERDGVLVRRMVLHKTRHLVYYEVDHDAGTVWIIAIWGAPRGEGPDL